MTRTLDTKDTKMEFRNMKITDYQHLTKDFQFLEQKLGVKTGYRTYGIEATKTNIFMWRLLVSSSMKAGSHPWTSSRFRTSSISRRHWYWNNQKIFWMWRRSKVHHLVGGDRRYLTIRWYDGQTQKCEFTQISYCVFGRCLTFQKQIQDGQSSGRLQNVLFDGRVAWNWCTSNWIRVEYFPGFTTLQILQEIQDDLQKKNIKPEHIIFMSMFNDIEWAKRNIDENMHFEFRKKSSYMRRDFREDTGRFVGLGDEKKKDYKPEGRWKSIASLMVPKTQGDRSQSFSREPVPWVVESWEGQKEKRPHTSTRILQTQSFYFESFTPRISSESTEQLRIGAINSVYERLKENLKSLPHKNS